MTTTVLLTRDYRDAHCTLGVITVNGRSWQTLERPWVLASPFLCGQKGVSCVPVGDYRLVSHSSEAHPKVWALVNPKLSVYHWDSDVPVSCGLARTMVLIHAANYPEELRGCVAVGKARLKDTKGAWWINQSRDSLNELRSALSSSYDLQLFITERPTCLPLSNPTL